MCMDTNNIKDNDKIQTNLAEICNRRTLELINSEGKLHAPFCLKPKDKSKC